MTALTQARAVGAGVLATGALLAGAALIRRLRPGADLEGRVALVTGGSRGLGFLLARELLGEGCRVVICARDPETLARARKRLERETGGVVVALECDVGDPAAVDDVVTRTIERFGRLDVVVNNAALIQVAPLETLGRSDFEAALDSTFWGAVHTTLAVLPYMLRQGGGRIVNISSIGGAVAVPHLLPYDAAKHALVGLSEGLRAELTGHGIAVTTVLPGLMRTGSPVHVEYRGQPEKEYVWFALGDQTPLTAMSARRAAAAIVRAARRGDAFLVLTWQAKLLRLTHALAPAFTDRVMAVMGRLLPGPGERPRSARGRSLRGTLPDPLERALDRSARASNQV